jgi:hypothetical protein
MLGRSNEWGKIRKIFERHIRKWDPNEIGLEFDAVRLIIEYNQYINCLTSRVCRGERQGELVSYLSAVEELEMGLQPNREKAIEYIEAVVMELENEKLL